MARVLQGVLLIGGMSQRMGRPKTQIEKESTTLGAFLCELLRRHTGCAPLLLGQGESGFDDSLERVHDLVAGAGPLSALLGLFEARPGEDFLVLACDLFAMDDEALVWLLSHDLDDHAVLWPKLPGRPFGEPLAGIYRANALPFLRNHWQAGRRGLRDAIPLKHRFEPLVPEAFLTAFRGVNTPTELAEIRRK